MCVRGGSRNEMVGSDRDRYCGPDRWLGRKGFAQGTWPTPEIREIDGLEAGAGVAHAMRAELGDTRTYVGLGLICDEGGAEDSEALVFFRGFRADRRPVQLAVRSSDGRVSQADMVVRSSSVASGVFREPMPAYTRVPSSGRLMA